MSKKPATIQGEKRTKMVLTIVFTVIAIVYLLPIFLVLINSFKSNAYVNTDTFALPNEESFVGVDNYVKGMTFGNYPFAKSVGYSLFITIVSSALILVCTSMAAWYIARVGSTFSKIVYYLCVFSMVVPFQMVMFTLPKTADTLKLNTPWTIPIIYLGFGAGLAVFMFSGFVKSIPLSIEEAHPDFCGCAGDHVGMERLSASVPGSGPEEVYDHSHSHSVSEGLLRLCGYGCDYGSDPSEHCPCYCILPDLPEAYHQGRGRRRCQGLTSFIPAPLLVREFFEKKGNNA